MTTEILMTAKNSDDKKEELLQVMVTKAFKEDLNSVASYRGLGMSSYVRMILMEAVERDLERKRAK